MSQGLIFKASCIELGTPYETRSYLHYQAKIQIWEWGRERFLRRKGLMKSHIQTYVRYSSSTWYYFLCSSLSLSLSFFFLSLLSLLCVYLFSFSVFAFLFFFPFVCTPSIYGEIPKKLFPYFSLNWSDHGAVFVRFSSTPPNFMLSRDPFFSFFSLLFVSFLFKLPLFSLWHPHFSTFQVHFHQTVFLTFWWCHFLIHFSAFVFVLLDLCLSFAFVLGSRLWTWLILLLLLLLLL